ncbi:UV-stimulated scaffold protein A-like [Oratosquilla oratoria]|uniref:UV-stimulated scaffold protein A-like n=1 Tax=Oratosquilla oratoria TaxID=337810 RepID=UPI003F76AA1E
MENDTRKRHLSYLVFELTTSGKDHLDENKMKQLKKICKHSEFYVIILWEHLQKQLKKQHAEIRLSAFQICDEIFHRSHCFRELLLKDFTDFAAQTIGFDRKNPLPKPKPVAKTMQQKAIEAIQRWYDKFKDGYHTLRMGYKYLKEVKKVDFEELTARTEEERQRILEDERKAEETKQKKIGKVREEMEQNCDDIKDCLTQFHNSFKLLIPDLHDFYIPYDDEGTSEGEHSKESSVASMNCVKDDGDNKEEYGSSYMREHGLTKGTNVKIDMDEVKKIQETNDNDIIIASIQEQSELLMSKYFPLVKKWEQSIMQYSAGNTELMKRIIEEKNKVERALKIYSSMNIVKSKAVKKDKDDSDSDDDFIDVPEKTCETPVPESVLLGIGSSVRNVSSVYGTTSKSSKTSTRHDDDPLNQPSTSGLQNMTKKVSPKSTNKNKTPQKKCPDSFLEENWVPPAKMQNNMAGLSQVWVANDDLHEEVEGKSTGILGIDTCIVDYQLEFEPVKWECRAPLPSGRLCPRMDRERCPLHGPIIPRDLIGQPVSSEDIKREKEEKERQERENPAWQDPELLAAIHAETGVDLDMKKAKLRKRKHPNLTNLKELGNTPKRRLANKVFSKKALRRVNAALAKANSANSRGHFNFG